MAKVLFFGITKDLTKTSTENIEIPNDKTSVSELKDILLQQYPELSKVPDLMIAINTNYAKDDDVARSGDEIAIIPPTNGG
ncbi:MAG: molybdopterin converting factor subunit 1 [Patescibacteria group bacterium]